MRFIIVVGHDFRRNWDQALRTMLNAGMVLRRSSVTVNLVTAIDEGGRTSSCVFVRPDLQRG